MFRVTYPRSPGLLYSEVFVECDIRFVDGIEDSLRHRRRHRWDSDIRNTDDLSRSES